MSNNQKQYIETFFKACIVALLWSENDTDGTPLDKKYNISNVDQATLDQIMIECKDFVLAQWKLLKKLKPEQCGPEQCGHDFALTRNGHGAGYWDRGYGKVGEQLTDACKPYGSCNLYVGDDLQVHVM